jgi:uncharacterized phage protein gp47/JayE
LSASDFTSSVPITSIDATGCHVPPFEAVYAGVVADFQRIYGADVVNDFSTQDMEWLGILAKGYHNCNTAVLAAYNAFSPATAQGAGLSSVVKTNGIARLTASYSTVDIVNIGQAGAVITNPILRDPAGYIWAMPSFTIPLSGQITETATCTTLGAIPAPAGTFTSSTIGNPQRGWQSVSNALPAALGAPVEADAQLRVRQSLSVAKPSRSTLDGIVANLLAIPGVTRLKAFENDTDIPDANGIPGGAISIVIDGGDAAAIAQTILIGKGGAGTYGTSTSPTPVLDAYGIPRPVYFFRPLAPKITFGITIKKLPGYSGDVPTAIKKAVSDWTNALGIGGGATGQIRMTRVYAPALLVGTVYYDTFEITGITVARDGRLLSPNDVAIAFNEAPTCDPTYITVTAS